MNCNTAELIEVHQTAINILETINLYKRKINRARENSKKIFHGFFFAEQSAAWEHDIIIYKMCIDRLEQRYNKILNN